MSKKDQQSTKKQKVFLGKESFHRMNFLYQASVLLASKNQYLSSSYGNLCKNISKKTQLRLHPDIKRTLCKKCGLALRPSQSAKVDVIDEKRFVIECGQCGFKKSFLINSEYNFWLDNPESVIERIVDGKTLEQTIPPDTL